MAKNSIIDRLNTARLKPTVARIRVLQLIAAAGSSAISSEEVFLRMLKDGTPVGIGTVYRTIRRLEAHDLLLREWGPNRKALFRIRSADGQSKAVRVVCCTSGRSIVLSDEELHDRLEMAAHTAGLPLEGGMFYVEVGSPRHFP